MRVALGDVGRPPLPLGEEAGQVVDGADELVADQELGPPGRGPGPALEQGDQRLAAVVGRVQGGQVGDLEGDQHQAGAGGDEVDHPGPRCVAEGEAEGEHRGPGLGEGRGDRPCRCPS